MFDPSQTRFPLALACALAWTACPAQGVPQDLTELSLEALMAVEITSASKYAQSIATAPATVTIVTRDEIRSFGWRTLADVLNAQRGFHVINDRTYHYLGVRGLAPPGDYDNRILFLIDGMRVNDNVFDSVMAGETFPLDLDLVERIEIVRGPGAVMYGGNALFGSINLVTRAGAALAGVEGRVDLGSRETRGARLSAGRSQSGVDWLLSVSGAYAEGERFEFADVAPGSLSPAGADAEQWRRLFGKFSAGDWRGQLVYGKRKKYVPTGAYGTIPNDGAHREDDAFALAELGREFRVDDRSAISARVFFGHYRYDSVLPYDYSEEEPPRAARMFNRDRHEGQWQGFEARWQSSAWDGQRWIVGLEGQLDSNMTLTNFDEDGTVYSRAEPSDRRWGIYAQDEIMLGERTTLTLGLRHDVSERHPSHWSPRLALVHRLDANHALKLMHGTAFRNPNPYEHSQLVSAAREIADLKRETLRNTEIAWEAVLGPGTSFSASAYQYRIRNIIFVNIDEERYENGRPIDAQGVELELAHRTRDGWKLGGSYAAQYLDQDGERPDNAPSGLLKLRASRSFGDAWRAGAELLALNGRRAAEGTARVAGHALANLNVGYRPAGRDWDLALHVHNLFDRRYRDPAPSDLWLTSSTGLVRESFRQDGRLVSLAFTVWFR